MTSSPAVGIQADDLTGACDTAGPFAARGFDTLVLLPGAQASRAAPAVLVLDTESRGRPAPEARALARGATARLVAAGARILYKKVDSALRGALAAELDGALDGAGRDRALLAPAFPAHGRLVTGGLLHIGGQPADRTALARDPTFPPTGASVLALLGVAGPRPATVVPLVTVRRGPAAVQARIDRDIALLAADAETDADLDILVEATLGRPLILAGSAGLATALAARLAGNTARRPGKRPRAERPLLVVVGSAHPSSRDQLRRLAARGVPGEWLGDGTEPDGRAGEGDRFLAAPPMPGHAAAPGEAATLPPTREARALMAARLGAAARRLREPLGPRGTLLLTGGETAAAVLQALGATGLRLLGEVEPGLPAGTLLDGPFQGQGVITKAGSFGDPDTLVRLWESAT